jgi:methyl-accepting chemotaxis protein
VGVDDRCALGQWIHGEAKQYSGVPEYGKLVQEHKAFHASAAKVIEMVAAGKLEEAKTCVDKGEFFDASLRTINAIRHLRTKVAP